MAKERTVTLSEAIEAYLDEAKSQSDGYRIARAFCEGEPAALKALDIVNKKMLVILDCKADLIKRMFCLDELQFSSAVMDVRCKKMKERSTPIDDPVSP